MMTAQRVGRQVAWVCAGLVLVLGAMAGCASREETEEEIEQAIQDAVRAEVDYFSSPDENFAGSAWLNLDPHRGEEEVSTADLITAVAIVDTYRGRSRWMPGNLDLVVRAPHLSFTTLWVKPPDGSEPRVIHIRGFSGSYDESFCQLPTLTELGDLGPGSDFTRIAECNPELEALTIDSWENMKGGEGINGLTHLKTLDFVGEVSNVDDLPYVEGLERVGLFLPARNAEDRATAEAKFPGSEIRVTPLYLRGKK